MVGGPKEEIKLGLIESNKINPNRKYGRWVPTLAENQPLPQEMADYRLL